MVNLLYSLPRLWDKNNSVKKNPILKDLWPGSWDRDNLLEKKIKWIY